MGYIERAAGIANFSSGVISFWFNAPAASLAAKTVEWEEWNDGDQIDGNLIGVVPIFTFGPNEETAYFSGTAETGNLSPCVVGILCDNAGPHLYARFQYDHGERGDPLAFPTDFNDFFEIGGFVGTGVRAGSGAPEYQYISVTADTWHHVLISFDFSAGCSTVWDATNTVNFSSTCPFYWAFDDVNYNGDYLHPNTPSVFNQSAVQGIVSNWSLALMDPETEDPNPWPSTYSFDAGDIPTSDYPFGVPVTADRDDHNARVRMAEFKLFRNVTLDTSVEINRRAFISNDGIVITPASPALAVSLLGKEPEVYFQTHTDFITGNNRGTEGDFTPTGTITTYNPGP